MASETTRKQRLAKVLLATLRPESRFAVCVGLLAEDFALYAQAPLDKFLQQLTDGIRAWLAERAKDPEGMTI